jgi:hypothetical protein
MLENGLHYAEYAKLQYGRRLWKYADFRQRLLAHWTSPEHPHAERFGRWRAEVESLLNSTEGHDEEIDTELRSRGLSLRAVTREIPSVFGDSF